MIERYLSAKMVKRVIMASEMGHLCNLRILMAAVKMTIFS